MILPTSGSRRTFFSGLSFFMGNDRKGALSPLRAPSLSSPRFPRCHPERSEGSALVRSSDALQLGAGSERSEGSAPVTISRFNRSRFFVASLLRMTRRGFAGKSDFPRNDRFLQSSVRRVAAKALASVPSSVTAQTVYR